MRVRLRVLILAAGLVCLAAAAGADVRMHRLFTDDMVLQRDVPVPVYGWAEPGEKVTVEFRGQSASAVAGPDGKWVVKLAKMSGLATPQDMTVKGNNTIVLRNILVGDVWLCSGQSNMAFGLGGCNAPDDIKNADFAKIRFITLPCICKPAPTWDIETNEGWMRWNVCRPDNAGGISAVAFYFARRVQNDTGIPIGLLVSSVGGTNIEKWMSQESFGTQPLLADYAKNIDREIEQYHNDLAEYLDKGMAENSAKLDAWKIAAKKALEDGVQIPESPELIALPLHPSMPGSRPGGYYCHLFNGMIAPLTGFPIKGALWYQGENNSEETETYVAKMEAMITDWRAHWGTQFPFYYVQLANFLSPSDIPSGDDNQAKWQRCRMAQLQVLNRVPKTGMAVTIDIGDAADIHPKNKFGVGERLALWALAKDYGERDIVFSGPLYKSMKIDGGKAVISFDCVGGGLIVGGKGGLMPGREVKGGKLARFAIAGEDKVWHWADAQIVGNTVVVSSPDVPKPVAVRYAYHINPDGCNLYNKEGLPASPFRTDSW